MSESGGQSRHWLFASTSPSALYDPRWVPVRFDAVSEFEVKLVNEMVYFVLFYCGTGGKVCEGSEGRVKGHDWGTLVKHAERSIKDRRSSCLGVRLTKKKKICLYRGPVYY